MNEIAIDLRSERMRAAEERRVNSAQGAAEAEKVQKEIEEKEKEARRLKEKEQRKAARKAEKERAQGRAAKREESQKG